MTAENQESKAYDNYQEIIDKINKSDIMSGADKYMLQFNINDVLPKEEHAEIIKIVLKNTNRKAFTPGKTSTYIDLNDLSPSTLWKLHYYVNFCLENLNRDRKIDEIKAENDVKRQEFEQKIQEELKKKIASGEIKTNSVEPTKNRLYNFVNIPSYETLRDQAVFANNTSGEQIKITQMRQLNIQQDQEKEKKTASNGFFRAYTNKKPEVQSNIIVKIPLEENPISGCENPIDMEEIEIVG